MTRIIPATARAELEAPDSFDAILAFVTISHPLLAAPIRVVSDVLDYVLDGSLYQGLPFGFSMLTDTGGASTAQLTVQNVDRRIGLALLGLNERAKVSLVLLSSADFDLSVVPRAEVPGGAPIYDFAEFDLVDVTCTAGEITVRVMLRDFSQEPFPGQRCTETRFPALFL